jgi:succinyl-CoA synthetase beta subunit
MNHAYIYCKTLESVSREKLVNGVHAALMHFYAIRRHESLSVVNINPVTLDLERLLAAAGHIGFDGEPVAEGTETTAQQYHAKV